MKRLEQLKQINRIRLGSKWCIKSKKDVMYYVNIGMLSLSPHQHISVDAMTLTHDNIMINVSHTSGHTCLFTLTKFNELFEEITYPDAKLKSFVDAPVLFRDIKKEFNININEYYNSSTGLIQINDVTFECIINYMEKNNLVDTIISKKEADYIKHGKGAESKSYGLQKNNKVSHGPKSKTDRSVCKNC